MIGIGVSTTPNRKDVFANSFLQWFQYQPDTEFKFVIEVDEHFEGIAKTKNRLLAQLDDCEHIFLSDDDCYPIAPDWWKAYIESKEPHLMYQFKLPGKPTSDMLELYRDDEIVSYSHTRGAFIYLHKTVLDVVGGFDTAYIGYGFEHSDYTNRIHNAGLTTHRAMDIVGSDKLLYCLDQDGKIESSIPDTVKKKNWHKNYMLYRKNKNSKEHREYK